MGWKQSQPAGYRGCLLRGYTARLESGTNKARNLSPSLRGCYADPIELAMEEHSDRLPKELPDPGGFETIHNYSHDPSAWPRRVKVITICRGGYARSFAMAPNESLSVFPPSELAPS